MEKMKKVAYALSSATLLAPAMVLAQWDPGRAGGASGLSNTPLVTIISTFMKWLLIILGFLAIIGFVIAGIMYITAAGDEGQLEKAKSAMVWSIVGVVVALVGYIIIQAVTTFLGGGTTTF